MITRFLPILLLLTSVLFASNTSLKDSTIESSQQQSAPKNKKDKRVRFVGIPTVSYNRSFGAGIGFMTNLVYDVNRNDTVSPPSMAGIFGSFYTNKTYFIGGGAKNYFKEDKWRTKLMIAHGKVNFQTYVELPPELIIVNPALPSDTIVDYSTTFFVTFLAGMRQIVGPFYLGLQCSFQQVKTTFDLDELSGKEEKNSLFGFGLASEYDTRNNIFNPSKGANAKIRSMSFLTALGSTTQYHRIATEYNHYFNIAENMVILARYYGIISVGDVPFAGQNIVGRDDLRGYSSGEYRGNQVYDLQAAFRWKFYKRLGAVAFGGIAVATDDWEGTNYSGILPAGGVGFRFMLLEKRKMNAGIDIAWGKNDWGLYFRLGEAFTK